jgi:predicted MPP superfamily phosphohydrolase
MTQQASALLRLSLATLKCYAQQFSENPVGATVSGCTVLCGRFEVIGNGPLIVSRGVDCSNLPIRINADPEFIICTLQ